MLSPPNGRGTLRHMCRPGLATQYPSHTPTPPHHFFWGGAYRGVGTNRLRKTHISPPSHLGDGRGPRSPPSYPDNNRAKIPASTNSQYVILGASRAKTKDIITVQTVFLDHQGVLGTLHLPIMSTEALPPPPSRWLDPLGSLLSSTRYRSPF